MAKKQLIQKLDVGRTGMPGSRGYTAQAYRAGNWVVMSGQTAYTLDGEVVGIGDPAAQARQACENIKRLMELAGGTMDDVVKLVVYVTDRAHRAVVYPIIRSYFGAVRPCGTGVVVQGLARPEFLVEIDAWGFIDDPD